MLRMRVSIALVCLLLQSCVTQTGINTALQEYDEQNAAAGREVTLARGERNLDFSKEFVIKAFLTTFGQYNMAVINLDKELGYILGEGAPPAAPEELERIGKEEIDRLNEITQGGNPWRYTPGLGRVRATVNLFEKSDNFSTAKLTFSSETLGMSQSKSHSIAPGVLEAYYSTIWGELDKQLFILQGTIDN